MSYIILVMIESEHLIVTDKLAKLAEALGLAKSYEERDLDQLATDVYLSVLEDAMSLTPDERKILLKITA